MVGSRFFAQRTRAFRGETQKPCVSFEYEALTVERGSTDSPNFVLLRCGCPAKPDGNGVIKGDLTIYGAVISIAARFNSGNYFKGYRRSAARIAGPARAR